MRGKAIDTEFVSIFVQECLTLNKTTPAEICEEALERISEIENQLRLRNKLTDVLSHFNYKKKIPETKDAAIDLSKINKNISNDIFSIILNNKFTTSSLITVFNKFNDDYKKDVIFTFKQLLEAKILSKDQDGIVINGDGFVDFNGKI
jgi:hypothetical protein